MKRRTEILALAVLVAGGAATPAVAQGTNDRWEVMVAPYFMGASMSGTTTVRGRELEVDVSASDIFSNLEFGAMGLVTARKGSWGFGGDAIWMALGSTVRNTTVDFNQGAFAFYGLRRLAPAAELTFGLRVNTLQGELDFTTPDVNVQQDKTWVDPIVGLTLRTPQGRAGRLPRVHRGRRVRGRVGRDVAGLPDTRNHVHRQLLAGARLPMARHRLLDRRGRWALRLRRADTGTGRRGGVPVLTVSAPNSPGLVQREGARAGQHS